MKPVNRREALALLGALPLTSQLGAQTRPTGQFRVFLGGGHGLILEPGGTLKAWLSSAHNGALAPTRLGLGHDGPAEPFTLYSVPNVSNVVSACASAGGSFAVLGDGRILSWGLNDGSGQLGTTPRSEVERTASWGPNSNTPIDLATKFDATAVSCHNEHALALARDGSVYAWGRGISGELGIGPMPIINFKTRDPESMNFVPFPVRIPDFGDVAAISAGPRYSMALMKDGTVRTWGDSGSGVLGDGSTTNRDRPMPVPGVRDAVAIAAGGMFCVALLANGTVMTWGRIDNNYSSLKITPKPVPVPGVSGIRAIAAGNGHAAGITDAGTVVTWGTNQFHQLGRGRNVPLPPGPVASLTGAVSLTAAAATTIAVLSSGRIMTWGGVRPWHQGEYGNFPILLWIDGLDQS